ncbi:IS110 family transposase, partial [Paraburkholderia sp. EG286B]|uniref:IS110 family transposase n=1 Tax=Paraburkholderia sp. EG286B TaxID=3237011 RepID=UPI0034D2AAEC
MLLRGQARCVQHMQKALAQMNIQLANVISDVAGETGQRIIRAIVAGERDPYALAAMKHGRIRASRDDIAQSLHGHWRTEHLFALRQALAHFDFHGTQLAECDRALQASLTQLHAHAGAPGPGRRSGRTRNSPQFDLRTQLFQMCGVDLTRINGIEVTTALAVLSEIGADLSRFPSVKHFTSWLGLCPGTRISGGKTLSGKSKRTANRAAHALKLAAAALRTSQSALGAYFRRMCARLDKPKAIAATAHKLARLIYMMLTKGEEFVDRGEEYYEERYRQRVLHHLTKRAEKLGMKLMPAQTIE